LRIDDARIKLNSIKSKEPNNLALVHLDNYIDFFILFIKENKSDYNDKINFKQQRIDYLESIKIRDPYFDFIKAEILLQWALIHLKFDDKLKAGSAVYDAYKYLEKNKAAYPQFLNNNKSLSVIHALAESVPNWVRKVIGVKGSIALGKKEIEEIADYAYKNKNYFFREEVATIYSYILFYQLNQKNKAIDELERFKLESKQSPLLSFLKASMYLRNGNNEQCLRVLNELEENPAQMPFHYLSFMKGRSLLYKQDGSALKYLQEFTDNFKGRHFIKEAYQKMAWYELSINNDLVQYKKYMGLVQSKGYALVDEDKQALKEAKSLQTPNTFLLKSRILYDGGYFSKAQAVLIKNEASLSNNKSTVVEFNYRMARILQSLKNYTDAIFYFKETVGNGGKENYFATSAALQLGFIYEELKQVKNAKYYYQQCLNMDPPEYKNSLHQKAKSGLLRLSK
jgi:tetratricopeptide (TPR) repeat protein